jgi:predicted phage baseplate assembly protein
LAFLADRRGAITLSDFQTLALATPGVPVARARALAGHHPSLPCVTAAGSVTVVAVPSCPDVRPEAGPDFLAAVHRWLAPRCALTTELHVLGPSYQAVGVHARLHAEAGADPDALAAAAAAALDRFFHPLEGGPDGTGWPVGRAVYRTEVMAVLNAIEGVAYVDQLSLLAEGEMEASCANVTLCTGQMVAAGEHRIQVIARRPLR